jgi:Protein of unknown function (DUF3225)
MQIDAPAALAEVKAAFHAYEAAFIANDTAALDAFFWQDARMTRYGVADRQYGPEELRAYRDSVIPVDLPRQIKDLRVTCLGDDFAIASMLFFRASAPGITGRQMQSWARIDGRWLIVAAHVSLIRDGQ